MIQIARASPACRELDAALRRRGLRSERDILHAGGRRKARWRDADPDVVIVLSRQTLGADVAITAPVLGRMRVRFPQARLCFLGGEGARAVASCFHGVEYVPVPYGRTATLAARLNAWPRLCAAVDHLAGAPGRRCLVIDPDSRLTQLGLLPPTAPAGYRHFPSRSYGADTDSPLGTLVQRWLDEIFGAGAGEFPLRLCARDAHWAAALRGSLTADARPLVCVNFGVGGNGSKAAGRNFETRLLQRILQRGWRVLLARGTGRDESARALELSEGLAQQGIAVLHLPSGRVLPPPGRRADLLTWEADTGAFLAAIRAADLYVGYDSSGQHIAAALGVPALAIFVASAGLRHARRWAPRGEGPLRVLRASPPVDGERLLHRVCEAFAELAAEAVGQRTRRFG